MRPFSPGNPCPSEIDANFSYVAYAHAHKRVLKVTARESGVSDSDLNFSDVRGVCSE